MEDKELYKKIGRNIQNVRLQTGFTQEEFAEKIEKSWSHISKIESGQCNLTLKTINKMAELLNTDVSKILNID